MRNSNLIISAAVTFSAILGIGAVSAADMAVKARPMAVDPGYNWTGFYIGANAGGVWSDAGTVFTASPVFFSAAAQISADGSVGLNKSGFTGGAQVGYNWQRDRFVLGVEADINYTDLNKSVSITRAAAASLPLGYTVFESISSNWLATFRGRAGFAANNWLFYGTGGLAVANFGFTQGSFFRDCPCGVVGSSSSTRAGWTAGGGVEYGVTSNWTVKAEYLYVNLGTQSFADSLAAGGFPGATFTHQQTLNENIVRVGLNYRFGGPVVAKY
jgi:outer membrane immunogenic protein